jgi:hypothetical protein
MWPRTPLTISQVLQSRSTPLPDNRVHLPSGGAVQVELALLHPRFERLPSRLTRSPSSVSRLDMPRRLDEEAPAHPSRRAERECKVQDQSVLENPPGPQSVPSLDEGTTSSELRHARQVVVGFKNIRNIRSSSNICRPRRPKRGQTLDCRPTQLTIGTDRLSAQVQGRIAGEAIHITMPETCGHTSSRIWFRFPHQATEEDAETR